MLIGPFDRRKRRRRCDACSKSHLKCSGHSPCVSCIRRNHPCNYQLAVSSQGLDIRVDRGKQRTLDTYHSLGRQPAAPSTRVVKPPDTGDLTLFYFFHFDIFLQRNNFTGLGTPRSEVTELMRLGDPETYLRHAMLSLGAMQASKLCEVPLSKNIRQFALESYTRAIVGLRHALLDMVDDAKSRARILWTTLLLGLFELMHDSSGNGWLQHLVHGTAQALIASGPSTCVSGSCGRFFTESKVFEVCRAIVFNQPTFLAEERWMALSASLRASSTSRPQQTLDALLDTVVMCSSLRVRAVNLIESSQSLATPDIIEDARAISLRGFELRQQLSCWAFAHHTSNIFWKSSTASRHGRRDLELKSESELQLLAETFFSATSIYLSGVFDYEIGYWHSWNLPVPTLSEGDIQNHVTSILALGKRLIKTNLSPLLLLFPLRVASARAQQAGQRRQIMESLGSINSTFAVAGAFIVDIEDLWRSRSIIE